jgi:hypothetical protein
MSPKITQETPALLTSDGKTKIVFEARPNGTVQAKYHGFDGTPVVAQAGERAFRA